MKGFQREKGTNGIEILVARGWNYPEMSAAFEKATSLGPREPCALFGPYHRAHSTPRTLHLRFS